MSAREEILARIRAALRDVPSEEQPEDVAVPRDYRRADERPLEQLIALLCERVGDYRAEIRRVGVGDVAAEVARACADFGISTVVVPPDLPQPWRPEGMEVVQDDDLTAEALDGLGAVALTGCAAAIAETGTLVLDGHGACGRRLLTLVPDHHICVVRSEQVAGQVPEALAAVGTGVAQSGAPITLVSGASATSDIELSRVEGVHGPRHLLVLVAESE